MKNTTDWQQADSDFVWHPFSSLVHTTPVPLESAKGAWLYTTGGKAVLDAISSWWVNLHGHSNEYIADAVHKQALQLEHVIFAGFTHEPASRLAERLLQILPGTFEKVFFSDNGSTAVEVALKMALQYWYNKYQQSCKVLALEGAYHGDTFGSMAVGSRDLFTEPFDPYLFKVDFLSFPEQGKEEQVLEEFNQKVINGDVAVFIYEPLVQGAGGMRMYKAETLDAMLRIAKANGVICIADEVMTGFGRTGNLFASSYMEHQPDLLCMSKGITGGMLPMGATACHPDIVEAFRTSDKKKTFFHGHSFTGNPMACAAANASMDLLLDDECRHNIDRISEAHERFMKEELQGHPRVGDFRKLGTILAFEVATGEQTSYFNSIRDVLYEKFMDSGVLLRPLGNVVYIMPPYIVSNKELECIYKTIRNVLDEL